MARSFWSAISTLPVAGGVVAFAFLTAMSGSGGDGSTPSNSRTMFPLAGQRARQRDAEPLERVQGGERGSPSADVW
ncbi:MAG: hypothetical protein U0Q22_19355 [Acidimicrobiales bacterium]